MRKILITSGKGGVGKTTVTVFIGKLLAKSGKRVLILDGDFGLNNLDQMLGLDGEVQYDLTDVLNGKCRIRQAIIQDKTEKNLFVISSDGFSDDYGFTSQNVKAAFSVIKDMFDYLLIDSPAGIDNGFLRAVSIADEAIVVVNSYPQSVRDADKVIDRLESFRYDKISVVINAVRGDLILSGKALSVAETGEILKRPVIGVIPESDSVLLAFSSDKDFSKRTAKPFNIIVKNIEGEYVKPADPTLKYKGFLGGIRRSLRGKV